MSLSDKIIELSNPCTDWRKPLTDFMIQSQLNENPTTFLWQTCSFPLVWFRWYMKHKVYTGETFWEWHWLLVSMEIINYERGRRCPLLGAQVTARSTPLPPGCSSKGRHQHFIFPETNTKRNWRPHCQQSDKLKAVIIFCMHLNLIPVQFHSSNPPH